MSDLGHIVEQRISIYRSKTVGYVDCDVYIRYGNADRFTITIIRSGTNPMEMVRYFLNESPTSLEARLGDTSSTYYPAFQATWQHLEKRRNPAPATPAASQATLP